MASTIASSNDVTGIRMAINQLLYIRLRILHTVVLVKTNRGALLRPPQRRIRMSFFFRVSQYVTSLLFRPSNAI